MKIYLAGRWKSKTFLNQVAAWLTARGHEVTNRWLSAERPDDPGVQFFKDHGRERAGQDIEDIAAADALILNKVDGDGRHGGMMVEFGAAIALNKLKIVVGPAECVFTQLADQHFATWLEFYDCVDAGQGAIMKCPFEFNRDRSCMLSSGHDGNHMDHNGMLYENKRPVELGDKENSFHDAILANSRDLGPFLVEKNKAYGDSARRVSRMLEIFFPDGIPAKRIEDAYYMIQILNKLGRVAEDNDPMGEDPWLDACGYAMLAHCSKELKKEKKS